MRRKLAGVGLLVVLISIQLACRESATVPSRDSVSDATKAVSVDDNKPFVVGKTPLPTDPLAREFILRALALSESRRQDRLRGRIFVVGKTPLPTDPLAREFLLRALALSESRRQQGKGSLGDPPRIAVPGDCAGVPYCNIIGTGVRRCSDGCQSWIHLELEADPGIIEHWCMTLSGDLISCPWGVDCC